MMRLSLLQKIFNLSKSSLKENPKGTKTDQGPFIGYRYSTTIHTNQRQINFKGDILGLQSHDALNKSSKNSNTITEPTQEHVGDKNWKAPQKVIIDNKI